MVSLFTRCLAEFVGTFVLVLGGCGSAVFAAAFPDGKAIVGEPEPDYLRRYTNFL